MQFAPGRPLVHRRQSFNTASGMDCMQFIFGLCRFQGSQFQYRKRYGLHAIVIDNICKDSSVVFQYRKRYGLHAILSPGSLGNSEPKNRVSNDDPLFAFFPKVSGTFLSRKVLRKGLEASHSKGTFVHERNLILMAFSLDFRASLEQSIPRRTGACQQVSENFSSAVQAKIRRERFRRRSRWILHLARNTNLSRRRSAILRRDRRQGILQASCKQTQKPTLQALEMQTFRDKSLVLH